MLGFNRINWILNMNKKSILKSSIYSLLLGIIVLLLYAGNTSEEYSTVPLLSCDCPPGFKLDENNNCKARNLYNQYAVRNEAGVGGLKSALPTIRDGFSPQK